MLHTNIFAWPEITDNRNTPFIMQFLFIISSILTDCMCISIPALTHDYEVNPTIAIDEPAPPSRTHFCFAFSASARRICISGVHLPYPKELSCGVILSPSCDVYSCGGQLCWRVLSRYRPTKPEHSFVLLSLPSCARQIISRSRFCIKVPCNNVSRGQLHKSQCLVKHLSAVR